MFVSIVFNERICGFMVDTLNLLVQSSEYYAPFAGGGATYIFI